MRLSVAKSPQERKSNPGYRTVTQKAAANAIFECSTRIRARSLWREPADRWSRRRGTTFARAPIWA
jgi:hypothetical protein